MDYSLLINKRIIDILIGDKVVYDHYSLPYLKGETLCELSTSFGLPKTYYWGNSGSNQSRWMYMKDLLTFLNGQERIPELLLYLFKRERFDYLVGIGDVHKFDETHKSIINGAIKEINAQLVMARVELRLVQNKLIMVAIGEEVVMEMPNVLEITPQYIKELPDRIKGDLENCDYDSVITKSRTLIEEVLIFIIEKKTSQSYSSSGDLVKIYKDATELLNMRQKKEWDKRVNELLGGLHKLVSAISTMRNMGSDAHGAGSRRITIKKREALLVAYSSMMLAEYWLSVFEGKD